MLTNSIIQAGAKASHADGLGRAGRRIFDFVDSRYTRDADAAQRRRDAVTALRESLAAPGTTQVRGWIPLGPFVVRLGEGATRPATSGRAAGIAVSADGHRIYAASHNGGVWRSDDTGSTWYPLMKSVAQAPAAATSDSLACGAIAIDPKNPDIIFVGTGEGYAAVEVTEAGEPGKWIGYFGVGVLLSTDGGATFTTEPVAEGNPPLVGSGFFALAVDPDQTDRVLGATVQGLYRREANPAAPTQFYWVYQKGIPQNDLGNGAVTSVVAATVAGKTVFYAVRFDGLVYRSSDGQTWTPLATIPAKPAPGSRAAALELFIGGRISLAVPAKEPRVLYALTHNEVVLRLDLTKPDAAAQWESIDGMPVGFMNRNDIPLFGYYAQAIAVSPGDPSIVFIGGASEGAANSGALYRCAVSPDQASLDATFIGDSLHADMHALVFAPGDPSQLWVGTDGGVFYTANAAGDGDIFASRNLGLSTVSCNAFAQHPQNDAVLLCGTQDNGCLRFSGEEVWVAVAPGDGGATVIKSTDPNHVVSASVDSGLRVSADGGATFKDLPPIQLADGEMVLLYPPLVGNPPGQTNPADGDLLAFGTERPWISTDFGLNWKSIPSNDFNTDQLDGVVRALCFASPVKLYAGARSGSVYRFVLANGAWTRQEIPPLPGQNPASTPGEITSIAVDPRDPTDDSIYVTLGGSAASAHLLRFDGQLAQWAERSGGLPAMQLNALAVDKRFDAMYVAGDVGVWRSTDGGQQWQNFSRDLPEVPVLDLQFHPDPAKPLLRAATYGRGMYEYYLDGHPLVQTELYIRRNALDRGVYPVAANGLGSSPDIIVSTGGVHPDSIDFLQFADLATTDAPSIQSQNSAIRRVYVQVHNRATDPASGVYVALLAATYRDHLPPLRLTNLAGQSIRVDGWATVGVQTLNDVAVSSPCIAGFDLGSDVVGPPGGFLCLAALVYNKDDPLEASSDAASVLTSSPQVALRELQVM
jgi:hypothetical protein